MTEQEIAELLAGDCTLEDMLEDTDNLPVGDTESDGERFTD